VLNCSVSHDTTDHVVDDQDPPLIRYSPLLITTSKLSTNHVSITISDSWTVSGNTHVRESKENRSDKDWRVKSVLYSHTVTVILSTSHQSGDINDNSRVSPLEIYPVIQAPDHAQPFMRYSPVETDTGIVRCVPVIVTTVDVNDVLGKTQVRESKVNG